MKRFFAFAFYDYYPSGGIGFVKIFPHDEKGNIKGAPYIADDGETYYAPPKGRWHFGRVRFEQRAT